jgi:hypothetical protein
MKRTTNISEQYTREWEGGNFYNGFILKSNNTGHPGINDNNYGIGESGYPSTPHHNGDRSRNIKQRKYYGYVRLVRDAADKKNQKKGDNDIKLFGLGETTYEDGFGPI